MKIVLCCRVYPTHRPGGMPFVCQDRARALAALGHDVVVLTTGPNRRVKDLGVEVLHLDCEPQKYSVRFADLCSAWCKDFRPNILHTDSLDVSRPWYADFKQSSKVACTLHGFSWGAFLTKWNLFRIGRGPAPAFDGAGFLKEREALNKFDVVIGVSRHEHWMLRSLFGLEQARLVYNPIAPQFFQLQSPLPAERSFLCAAISGKYERGFDIVQKAADKARVSLKEVSGVPREAMPAQYDQATATVVYTSYSQGYDLTVAESLARGRPVIVSDVGSYLHEASRNPGLLVVPLGHHERLAEVLTKEMPRVPPDIANEHRPENHARHWLERILNPDKPFVYKPYITLSEYAKRHCIGHLDTERNRTSA